MNLLTLYLTVFTVILGVISAITGIHSYIEKHKYPFVSKRPERTLAVVIGIVCLISLLFTCISASLSIASGPTGNRGVGTQNITTSAPLNTITITPTTGTTPTPTDTPIPTVTPSPTKPPTPKSGDTLFTAKFDGSQAWVGDSSWHVYGNALHTSGAGTILVPYKVQVGQSGTPDFTIRFQATQQGDGAFGVGIRVGDDGSSGYMIGPTGYDINQHHWIQLQGTQPWQQTNFDPGRTSHIYEVTIIGDHITVKVDGALLLETHDGTYPTGESIKLYSQNVAFFITSLVIIQE